MKTATHRGGGSGGEVGLLKTTAGGLGTHRKVAGEDKSCQRVEHTPGSSPEQGLTWPSLSPSWISEQSLQEREAEQWSSHSPNGSGSPSGPLVLGLFLSDCKAQGQNQEVTEVCSEMATRGWEERPCG